MPREKTITLNLCVDETLLSSPLGDLLAPSFEPHNVNSVDHPIERTIAWDGWVVAVVDESTGLCAFVDELRGKFLGRRVLLVLQGLGDIDPQLARLQTSTDALANETVD